ncbi:MAG: S8 family serine peptidase [Fibrobacteres bacterium]|jgi:minor extracellular serine protease Vpr|nr:S8 family serine peptidase [Fibrobacterota bacterium]
MISPVLLALCGYASDLDIPSPLLRESGPEPVTEALSSERVRPWEAPDAAQRFVVGTTDSVAIARWLALHGWPHRLMGSGLFEVEVPPDSLDLLATHPAIDRVESPARRDHHALDASRDRINAQEAHAGTGLSRSHRGTKALVGIIDIGFDLNHPAFQDSLGNSRIVRLWDHTNTSGKAPAGFSTGTLFTTPEALKSLGRSGSNQTHGTHVAGLAAGRGWPASGGEWWGVADDARIALVDCGEGCRQINDGIKYLFRLGDSLKLPVAVNMSWGTLNGPRNGKSSDCVVTRSLVGPGKIVVASAGNTGGNAAHAAHEFRGDTARYALQVSKGTQTLSTGGTRTSYFNEVELWGDSAKSYQAWVEVLSAKDSLLGTSTVFQLGTGSSTYQSIDIRKLVGPDTLWAKGNIEKRSGLSGLRLSVSTNRTGLQLRMGVTATSGTVHGWIWEAGLDFLNLPQSRCRGCVVPDSLHVISDKATCPAVIAVGAISGSSGARATFTSRGPGLGPVPKPDLAAPGVSIISALNSGALGSSTVSGKMGTYPWGPMSGTSMSAPLVTGAIALLLEANPKLTTDSLVRIFKGSRTVHNPDTGWMRLDVFKLMQIAESTPVASVRNPLHLTQPTVRFWIGADGRRTAVPAGAMPRDFHPGGIAWLQTCQEGACTARGMVKPVR